MEIEGLFEVIEVSRAFCCKVCEEISSSVDVIEEGGGVGCKGWVEINSSADGADDDAELRGCSGVSCER